MQEARFFTPSGKPRAAGLGLAFEGKTGSNNSITDVAGVAVGYTPRPRARTRSRK